MESILLLSAGALIRLCSLLIGAFFVYLGYRLFSEVPVDNEGGAEISGPQGLTIKLTRIGPGVFFALFGTLIVVWTLNQPLQHKQTIVAADGTQVTQESGAATADSQIPSSLSSQRALTLQDIEFLNELAGLLTDEQASAMRHNPQVIIPHIKQQLMLPVWNKADWGEASAFVQWLERTGGLSQPQGEQLQAAAGFYRALPEDK